MPGGYHPPPSVVASWPAPNYTDPVLFNRTNPVTTATILGLISVVFVAARMVARFKIQRNAGTDDWLMLVALIPTYALTVLCVMAVRNYKYDRDIWNVPEADVVTQRKIYFAIQILYVWGATFIKLSVLSFDNRLGVQNVTKKFLWAVRFAFALVIAYFVIWNILIFRQCAPFEAFWYQVVPSWTASHSYHCIDEGANALTNTIISTVADFIAFLLPMILLWKLQMSMKQKVALSAVFAVGVLVCIVGVIRIYYYSMLYYGSYDVTWQGFRVFGTTDTELLLATICASAPALKIYFNVLSSAKSGKTIRDNNSNSNTNSNPKIKSRTRTLPSLDGGLADTPLQDLEKEGGTRVRQQEENDDMKWQSSGSGEGSGEEFDHDNEDGLSVHGSCYPLTGARVHRAAA